MKVVRIGGGAGFSGDRIEPAVDLARDGELDYLVFECLAERTIALAQLARARDPQSGYDPLLRERFEAVLPACRDHGVTIITNMGAANPPAAAAVVADLARRMGHGGLSIATVTGDDVLELVAGGQFTIAETGEPVATLRDRLVSANAYIGAEPLVEALAGGADVVITGRAADPSLFVAPLAHEFGWAMDAWHELGRGTLVGHLLECAGQVTGGYFADPGLKDVDDLSRLGFPIAEVSATGRDRDHQAARHRRRGDAGDVQGAAALRDSRSGRVHDSGRHRGFQPRANHRAGARPGRGRRGDRPSTARHAQGLARLP